MSTMTTARKQRLDLFIMALNGKFPGCFCLAEPKPLSLNIHVGIKEKCPEVDPKTLTDALRYYTYRPAYKHALLKQSHRINLDGSLADAVTTEEKEFAQLWLDNYKHARKVEAERKAQSQKPPKPKPQPKPKPAPAKAKPSGNKKGFAYPQKPAPAQPAPQKPVEIKSKFGRPVLKLNCRKGETKE